LPEWTKQEINELGHAIKAKVLVNEFKKKEVRLRMKNTEMVSNGFDAMPYNVEIVFSIENL
jgi:hypothetical protein